MAVVPGVFLDHVQQYPAHGGASGSCRIAPHLVEVVERGDHSAGMHTLRPPGDKCLRHIGRIDVVKGSIGGSLGAVVRRRVLIGQGAAEPATFDLSHMPHEPEQR